MTQQSRHEADVDSPSCLFSCTPSGLASFEFIDGLRRGLRFCAPAELVSHFRAACGGNAIQEMRFVAARAAGSEIVREDCGGDVTWLLSSWPAWARSLRSRDGRRRPSLHLRWASPALYSRWRLSPRVLARRLFGLGWNVRIVNPFFPNENADLESPPFKC